MSNFSRHVNGQPQCRLLLMPVEIRYAIYTHALSVGVHAFFKDDDVCLSPCINTSSSLVDGSECRPPGQYDDCLEQRWARRLGSYWGPHWECEEAAMASDEAFPAGFAIIPTCKALFFDVLVFMADRASLHVSDLGVLDRLVLDANSDGTSRERSHSSLSSYFLSSLLVEIKHLDISLKLPWDVCKNLDNLQRQRHFSIPSPIDDPYWASQQSSWIQLPEKLVLLKQLKKVTMWIDHGEICPWSAVDERSLFASLSQFDHLTINLPEHDPILHDVDWHYLPGSPSPKFMVHRRPRQLYYGIQRPRGVKKVQGEWVTLWGKFCVRSALDYPVSVRVENGFSIPSSIQVRREISRMEQIGWKRGYNVRIQMEKGQFEGQRGDLHYS